MLAYAHVADLHYGRSTNSTLDPKTGLQSSLVNDIQVLSEFLDEVDKENIDCIVIAGDVFDKIHVANAVRKEVAKIFRRMLETKHVYVIVGTHDRAHDKYAAHTLSDWKYLAGGSQEHMSRLHIFDKPKVVIHRDKGVAVGQFIALPEPTKGMLEGKTYLQYVEEAMSKMVLDEKLPTVVIGHFTVSGAKRGDESKDIASFNPDESIPSQFFDDKPFIDYVALGHIHMNQELGRTGKIVYPGSLNYCNFSELDMKKGGYICRISDEKVLEKKFVELKSPVPLKDVRFDIRGDKSPMESIRDALSKRSYDDSIVKVVVTLDESEQKNVDEKEIEKLIAGAKNVSISFNVIRGTRVRDAELTYEATPEQAFDRYLKFLGYDADTCKTMKDEFLVCMKIREEIKDN